MGEWGKAMRPSLADAMRDIESMVAAKGLAIDEIVYDLDTPHDIEGMSFMSYDDFITYTLDAVIVQDDCYEQLVVASVERHTDAAIPYVRLQYDISRVSNGEAQSVHVVADIDSESQTSAAIAIDVQSASGGAYTLPVASASVLGGVKVGSGLSIDSSGALSTEDPLVFIYNMQAGQMLVTHTIGEINDALLSGRSVHMRILTPDGYYRVLPFSNITVIPGQTSTQFYVSFMAVDFLVVDTSGTLTVSISMASVQCIDSQPGMMLSFTIDRKAQFTTTA